MKFKVYLYLVRDVFASDGELYSPLIFQFQ